MLGYRFFEITGAYKTPTFDTSLTLALYCFYIHLLERSHRSPSKDEFGDSAYKRRAISYSYGNIGSKQRKIPYNEYVINLTVC